MRNPSKFSRRPWAALCLALAGSVLVGCSGGGGGGSSDDNATTTQLSGVYTASSAGEFDWISFTADGHYVSVLDEDGCDPNATSQDASCFSVGDYTVDGSLKTLSLHDTNTGATSTYPLAAVVPTSSASSGSLVVKDIVTGGGGGSVVTSSSASVVSPSSVSLTEGNGSQSLVQSQSGSLVSCSGNSSSAPSSGSTNSCTAPQSFDGFGGHLTSAISCKGIATACMLLWGAYLGEEGPKPAYEAPPPITMTQEPPKPKN